MSPVDHEHVQPLDRSLKRPEPLLAQPGVIATTCAAGVSRSGLPLATAIGPSLRVRVRRSTPSITYDDRLMAPGATLGPATIGDTCTATERMQTQVQMQLHVLLHRPEHAYPCIRDDLPPILTHAVISTGWR